MAKMIKNQPVAEDTVEAYAEVSFNADSASLCVGSYVAASTTRFQKKSVVPRAKALARWATAELARIGVTHADFSTWDLTIVSGHDYKLTRLVKW